MSPIQENTTLPHDREEEEEDENIFEAVLSRLKMDQLAPLAAAVRYPEDSSPSLPTISVPLQGSYHILFPLTFEDGTRWLIKIPGNGTTARWDALSARSLTSEARTMQLIKRKTTIPLPEVFAFSSTTDNLLQVPYILMSFISGLPPYDVWFGKTPDGQKDNAARCTRTLQGIAAAMVQLDKFAYSKGGALIFDDDGNPVDIGPMRELDQHAALAQLTSQDETADNSPPFTEVGPFTTPKDFYTHMLDIHPAPESKTYHKGTELLLRRFIDLVSEPPLYRGKEFVLTHPDFDIQNAIVGEDGELRGLIDWGGVAAYPRSLGNERYPGCLTRDWDPGMYGYVEPVQAEDEDEDEDNGSVENEESGGEESKGEPDENDWEDRALLDMAARLDSIVASKTKNNVNDNTSAQSNSDSESDGDDDEPLCEDSPSQLALSRSIYLKAIRSLLPPTKANYGTMGYPGAMTRISLITDNLPIAAQDPLCRFPIMKKIVDEIFKHPGFEGKEEFDLYDVANPLGEGHLGEKDVERYEVVKQGFQALLRMEGL